jgi:iron complex outermembrane receptor protein
MHQAGAGTTTRRLRRQPGLIAGAWLLSGTALAQTVPASAPAPTHGPAGAALEQVVVTARRRAERLQTVPIAVTSLGRNDLARRGITNANDLARAVPSLSISGQTRSNSQYYLRGQTPGVINQGVHNPSSVVIYYLDVPTLTSGPGVFFDLANVAVLKGPQGTLFGRNTTGGAILFTPTAPKDYQEGYVQLRAGNHADFELEGVDNLPLVPDKLDIRIAGALARRNGFTDNVITGQLVDDRHYDSYRISIDARPADELDNLLVFDGRNINQAGSSTIPIEFNESQSLYVGSIPGPGSEPDTVRARDPTTGQWSNDLPASPLAYTQAMQAGSAGIAGLPIVFASNTKPSIFCLRALNLPGGLANDVIFGTAACPGPSGIAGVAAMLQAARAAGGFAFYNFQDLSQILARQQQLGPRAFASTSPLLDIERTTNITDITNWAVTPDLTLKNVLGYRFNRINQANDFAGTDIPIIRDVNPASVYGEDGLQQFSEELQLQGSTLDAKLKYIAGFYFEHATPGENTYSAAYQFAPPASFKAYPVVYNGLLADAAEVQSHVFNDSSASVFLHGEYDLGNFLHGLKLSGGARFNWDHRYEGLSTFLPGKAGCLPNPITGLAPHPCQLSQSGNSRAPTFIFGASEQIDPKWMLYASISRGYKGGGGNLPSPANAAGQPIDTSFKPEYVTAYEVGSKSDYLLVGLPGRSNVSLFHDDYRDVQVAYATIADGALAAVVQNAPGASIDGAEIEQVLLPIPNLTLSAYASWLRAAFGPGSMLDGISVKGRQLPYSPLSKYGVNASYIIPLGDSLGALALSADYARQSHVMNSDPLDPLDYYKGYDLVNLRADWNNIGGKPIDLSLVVNNAADATYTTGGYPIYGLAGFQSRIYGEPRMIYGQFTVHWGPGSR